MNWKGEPGLRHCWIWMPRKCLEGPVSSLFLSLFSSGLAPLSDPFSSNWAKIPTSTSYELCNTNRSKVCFPVAAANIEESCSFAMISHLSQPGLTPGGSLVTCSHWLHLGFDPSSQSTGSVPGKPHRQKMGRMLPMDSQGASARRKRRGCWDGKRCP